MKRSNLCVSMALCLSLCCCACRLQAQDKQPPALQPLKASQPLDTLNTYVLRTSTLPLPDVPLPAAFKHTGVNVLTDSVGILNPFWEKLYQVRMGMSRDTVRVVHIGDSHIRGRILPQTAGELLARDFGALLYEERGVNGAFCTTFTQEARIAELVSLRPDLLILSFGTNESHNRRYNAVLHYKQMDDLVQLIRENLPDTPLLMTTPPGSYDAHGRRRNRSYTPNPRTAIAVRTIRNYADEHGLAVWDLFAVAGGVRHAVRNWKAAGLMRPDHVHYLPEAYELQGRLLYQALIKAYNAYVGH